MPHAFVGPCRTRSTFGAPRRTIGRFPRPHRKSSTTSGASPPRAISAKEWNTALLWARSAKPAARQKAFSQTRSLTPFLPANVHRRCQDIARGYATLAVFAPGNTAIDSIAASKNAGNAALLSFGGIEGESVALLPRNGKASLLKSPAICRAVSAAGMVRAGSNGAAFPVLRGAINGIAMQCFMRIGLTCQRPATNP